MHLFDVINRLQSQLHFHYLVKDDNPQARRALLTSAEGDDFIKDIIGCAINTLNGNHKISKEEKRKLSKYENCLRALIDPKYSLKSKSEHSIQKVVFILPLRTSILSGVIGTLINRTYRIAVQSIMLVSPQMWEDRCQTPAHQHR